MGPGVELNIWGGGGVRVPASFFLLSLPIITEKSPIHSIVLNVHSLISNTLQAMHQGRRWVYLFILPIQKKDSIH